MRSRLYRFAIMTAALVGGVALLAAGFTVALQVRSVVAGPNADPGGPVPNPGHAWTEMQDHGVDGVTGDYWLGTSDLHALELRVNGARALRLEPNGVSPNLIAGYSGNGVTSGAVGTAIGGGGASGSAHWATDDYCTVSGGQNNRAGDDAGSTSDRAYATVGGGQDNVAGGLQSTVGGGVGNTANGPLATVGGGETNSAGADKTTIGGGSANMAYGSTSTVGGGGGNTASGPSSTVGGGSTNTAGGGHNATVGGGANNIASGPEATVGGGNGNIASGVSKATVAGGGSNTASGDSATVGGGATNTASGESATVCGGNGNSASADRASVCGGADNIAGAPDTTIGGGSGNRANQNWDTVGGGEGNTAGGWNSTVGGGYHNTASGLNATVPGGASNTAAGAWSFAAGRQAKANNQGCFVWGDITDTPVECNDDNRFIARAGGGVYLYTSGDLSTGSYLASGSGSWTDLSDRNLKDNFTPVDGQDVLARLAEIPIATWNYKAQDDSIRHMGPAAQDFSAAFGLGESDTGISTVDADGVALAAIQGLHELVQGLQAENADLRRQLGDLETRVAALEGGAETNGAGATSEPFSGLTAGWLALGGLAVVAGLVVVQRRRAGGNR